MGRWGEYWVVDLVPSWGLPCAMRCTGSRTYFESFEYLGEREPDSFFICPHTSPCCNEAGEQFPASPLKCPRIG